MFPECLKRSEGPPEALANKSRRRFRRVRPANRFLFVVNLPARAANRNGQVRIFGHRIRAEAARIVDGFRAPRAECSGNHRNAIQQIERALFQILTGHIFQCLPAREPADAIAYFYVSGYRADARIHEVADKLADRVWLNRGVGVDRHENAAGSPVSYTHLTLP